jgi:phosphoribosyl-AMP cyclohydrolase
MIRPDFEKGNGLVPCIVQDHETKEVLMLAYMNEEAFMKTLETGRGVYWSRSRQSLWIKGETSGHFQYVTCMNPSKHPKTSPTQPSCPQ